MRVIPAGDFVMGSTDAEIEAVISGDRDGPQFSLRNETPQFREHLPEFSIGVHAVTNEQFARFLTESQPKPEQLSEWVSSLDRILRVRSRTGDVFHPAPGIGRHPVICVSWVGANTYCEWAGLRLPTELEWEKAARGTNGRTFPWGNEWDPRRLCWFGSHDGKTDTAPVDAYPEGALRPAFSKWRETSRSGAPTHISLTSIPAMPGAKFICLAAASGGSFVVETACGAIRSSSAVPCGGAILQPSQTFSTRASDAQPATFPMRRNHKNSQGYSQQSREAIRSKPDEIWCLADLVQVRQIPLRGLRLRKKV
jgi:hypothetical protein